MTSIRQLSSFGADTNGGLLRDSWPDGVGRVPGPDDLDAEDMAPWQFVPISFESVCEWAVVGTKRKSESSDRARSKVLLYRDVGQHTGGVKHGVTLRLQGFVKSCNLQPLGSWDGYVRDFCVE
jgi:hypothetical protein